MLKYIVSWVLVSMQSVPCQPQADEFGRTSNITLYLECYQTIRTPKAKEFDSRIEAFKFYKRAKAESKKDSIDGSKLIHSMPDFELTNVAIDSINQR